MIKDKIEYIKTYFNNVKSLLLNDIGDEWDNECEKSFLDTADKIADFIYALFAINLVVMIIIMFIKSNNSA